MSEKSIKTIPLVKSGKIAYEVDVEIYEVGNECKLNVLSGQHQGNSYCATDHFRSLVKFREELLSEGLYPAVEGACVDVFPGGLLSESTIGCSAYRMTNSEEPKTVGTFDTISANEYHRLADPKSQKDFRKALLMKRKTRL